MRTMTLKQWEEELFPEEVEALHDMYHVAPEEHLTANEVLDAIVDWNGGIATGYHIRSIISRVYGIELAVPPIDLLSFLTIISRVYGIEPEQAELFLKQAQVTAQEPEEGEELE